MLFDASVAVGLFLYTIYSQNISAGSLTFDVLLAATIASILVAVILAIISASVVGGIVVAVLGLIDALIALICKVAGVDEDSDVDTWVCGGITGAMTESLVYAVSEQYIVVDLEDGDRLETAFNTPSLVMTGDASGYAAGNELSVGMSITNTITKEDDFGFGHLQAEAYGTHDLDAMLLQSSFSYTLQASESDQHETLALNSVDWDADNQHLFIPTGLIELDPAGINQPVQLYLTEAMNIPALSCWGFLVQGCERKDYATSSHTDLSGSIVLDVFPSSFSDFIRVASVDSGSYRLAWDQRFPTLIDGDGDGLLSQAEGGSDPNDSRWDSDDDGLSDYYEQENDLDPEHGRFRHSFSGISPCIFGQSRVV